MRDIAAHLVAWRAGGVRFAVGTVVRTWRSAPRPVGASMAVAEDGEVVGSVSGGCVESAVYEVATEVLATGVPRLVSYGVSDDDAFEVGLTCGGTIEVFVQPVDEVHYPDLPGVLKRIDAGEAVAVASVVSGRETLGGQLVVTPSGASGTLGDPGLDASVTEKARGMLAQGATGIVHVGRQGQQRMDDLEVFVDAYAPPARMLVFGAIDFAGAVARVGKFLGYHVTVCDARPLFATRKRFPDVDELVVRWPHRYLDEVTVDERTVICVLTHDPKFDVPVLQRALKTPARYIGAMGSLRTHEDRLARLREAGVDEDGIARICSPIGLDLGARTPEEVAISIAAEIVATQWGGTGQPLTGGHLPIHR